MRDDPILSTAIIPIQNRQSPFNSFHVGTEGTFEAIRTTCSVALLAAFYQSRKTKVMLAKQNIRTI